MEIRTLRSFVVVADEQNMTRAAKKLNTTQSALSKQVKSLESELGKKLFERSGFGIELTVEGRLLREHVRDLIAMADRISSEFDTLDGVTGGEIYFGLAESHLVSCIARQVKALKEVCPGLRYSVQSGTTDQVIDRIDNGILDFAALAETPDSTCFSSLQIPGEDIWGVVMPEGCELASKDKVTFDDLVGLPLLCSSQGWQEDIPRWCGRRRMAKLELAGSFGLSYNGSIFVREGLGYLLSFDRLVDTSCGSGLAFRPLEPALTTKLYLIWKKSRELSPIAERFVQLMTGSLRGSS